MESNSLPDRHASFAHTISQLLSGRQKELLKRVVAAKSRNLNATQLADLLTSEAQFSRTAVWYNLGVLRSVGLLDCGQKDDKGKPVILTEIGEKVAEVLHNANE